VEYACVGPAGVVTPCLATLRTRAKRFHAALRRVLLGAGRPVHIWVYRGRDSGRCPSSVDAVIVWAALGRRRLVVKPRAFSLCPQRVCGSTWRCRVAGTPRHRRFGRPSGPTAPEGPTEKPHPSPPPRQYPAAAPTQGVRRGRAGATGQRRRRQPRRRAPGHARASAGGRRTYGETPGACRGAGRRGKSCAGRPRRPSR